MQRTTHQARGSNMSLDKTFFNKPRMLTRAFSLAIKVLTGCGFLLGGSHIAGVVGMGN
jgi:hypothetical protein